MKLVVYPRFLEETPLIIVDPVVLEDPPIRMRVWSCVIWLSSITDDHTARPIVAKQGIKRSEVPEDLTSFICTISQTSGPAPWLVPARVAVGRELVSLEAQTTII